MRRMGLAVIAAAACGSSGSAPAPAPGPSCADRAAAIAAWAAEIEPEAEAAQILGDHLAAAPDLPLARQERAPQVELTRAGVAVEGEPVAILDLPDRLAAARASYGDPARPSRVIVAIDADVQLDQVATVTQLLAQAGATDVGLAFAHPGKAQAPPASKVSAEVEALRALPVSERAAQLARIAVRVIEPCQALGDLFTSMAPVSGPDKTPRLLHGIAPALTRCDCALDLDELRTLVWALFGPGVHTPKSLVDVTLVRELEPADLVVFGSAWADHTAELIRKRGKRVRFDHAPLIGAPPR